MWLWVIIDSNNSYAIFSFVVATILLSLVILLIIVANILSLSLSLSQHAINLSKINVLIVVKIKFVHYILIIIFHLIECQCRLYSRSKWDGRLRPQAEKVPKILTNRVISFNVIVLIKTKY